VQTLNTQFESELKKLIADEIERIKDIMAVGMAVKDYAEYRFHVGQIEALNKVSGSYCDEVTSIINKR
jgi:hypothetical protein